MLKGDVMALDRQEDNVNIGKRCFTKYELSDMFAMKLDGYSFREIADAYGVEHHESIRYAMLSVLSHKPVKENIVYPRAREWFSKHSMSFKQAADRTDKITYPILRNILTGRSKPSKPIYLEALEEIFGMDWEDLTGEEIII